MAHSPPPRFTGPMASGPFAPVRAEIDLVDCEVEGKLPPEINGTFYRVGPDFQYPPRLPTPDTSSLVSAALLTSGQRKPSSISCRTETS